MTIKTKLNLSILPVVFLVAACANSPGPVGENSGALLHGTIDQNHLFDVGVCLGGLVPEGQPHAGRCRGGFACSGTLIAPNLVLTARHCLQKFTQTADFCDGTFTNEPISNATFQVTTNLSVEVDHPQWTEVQTVLVPSGNNMCADDMGLLVLAQPIPNDVTPPVPVNVSRDLAISPPDEVAIVGRGATEMKLDLDTFTLRLVTGNLERRIQQNIPFVCASDGEDTCEVVDFSNPPSNVSFYRSGLFIIGSAGASGDSGSGVFDQASFGENLSVIGVTDAVAFGADGEPNFTLISRLDTQRDFILQGLRTAAQAMGLDPTAFNGQAQ